MDVELQVTHSHLKLILVALKQRQKRLVLASSRLSRHYNRTNHTATLIVLVEELQGVVLQDPDNWDDEPDLVPF